MIQTDTCEICRGGIYRDVSAPWDDDPWRHMWPELAAETYIRHIPHPRTRSSHDDDTTE